MQSILRIEYWGDFQVVDLGDKYLFGQRGEADFSVDSLQQ